MIDQIPRILTNKNIDKALYDYKTMLSEIPLALSVNNVLDLMVMLKRKNCGKGPYPHVSLFESANRIMTDLVILYGIKYIADSSLKCE